MAMSQQNTLNAMDDALNENVDKAMSMWNNLNPAGNIEALDEVTMNPGVNTGMGIALVVAVSIAGTVIGGLILDWLRGKK